MTTAPMALVRCVGSCTRRAVASSDLSSPAEDEMGCKGSAHGGNGREDVVTVSAETPDDDGTQRRHHHPNGVLGVGFVPIMRINNNGTKIPPRPEATANTTRANTESPKPGNC